MQFKTCIHIALAGGPRIGEIMGLEWQDVDFDNGTIEIRQASQYLPGIGTFTKEPKNETSKRIIGLPEPVMDMLAALLHEHKIRKVKLGNKWQGGSLGEALKSEEEEKPSRLFIQADSSPAHTYTPTKQLKKSLEKKNLPPLPFHGLRHTSVLFDISR